MIKINEISKVFSTKINSTVALDSINLEFHKGEFVTVLGESGAGKSTLLNLLGGLDKPTSGDLIIDGNSTSTFKEKDWDNHRNKTVGFIFQGYNLIDHLSVCANVELALTMSNMASSERKRLAVDMLKKVGLGSHINKRPNELSGGEKQRVAIARALVKNPSIILADEPTGALDSVTSDEVLTLLKTLCEDKLVIMISHNRTLAERYASHIVQLKDGKVIDDHSNDFVKSDAKVAAVGNRSMSYATSIHLSFKNLRTKKWRTFLTAFAGSLGIIGIGLILSISNGFKQKLNDFQTQTLWKFPITVVSGIDYLNVFKKSMNGETKREKTGESDNKFIVVNKERRRGGGPPIPKDTHKNELTKEYMNYLEMIPKEYLSGVIMDYGTNFTLISKVGDKFRRNYTSNLNWFTIPQNRDYLSNNYKVLAGDLPKEDNEIVIFLTKSHHIKSDILKLLGLDSDQQFEFTDVIDKELVVAKNDQFYQQVNGEGDFLVTKELSAAYNGGNKLKIVAVLESDSEFSMQKVAGLGHFSVVDKQFVDDNMFSNICIAQRISNEIVTPIVFSRGGRLEKNSKRALRILGGNSVPIKVSIYPKDFKTKKLIVDYLDNYKGGKIEFSDVAEIMVSSVEKVIDMITVVLLVFSSVSL